MTDAGRMQTGPHPDDAAHGASTTLELIIAWLWVGIPAAWGVWHVFLTSLKLFQ